MQARMAAADCAALNHTVLQMAADPQVAEKGQIQENRDFSLPYISHNVHYTKIM